MTVSDRLLICLLNTGGTIGSAGTPLAPLPAATFAQAIRDQLLPALTVALPWLDLHIEDLGHTLDSADMTPLGWCQIAGHILRNYADYDGFVVLHGTDSMDFTGAALPMLLNRPGPDGDIRLSKPVILTGAQMPLFRERATGLVLNAAGDGLRNLTGALTCLQLRLPEVTAFFSGHLFRASRIVKTSTQCFDAFESPHLPPLAELGTSLQKRQCPLAAPRPSQSLDDRDARALVQAWLAEIESRIEACPVAMIDAVPAFPAFLANQIRATLAQGAKALILRGFGEGSFPSGAPDNPAQGLVRQTLAEATEKRIPVIASTGVVGGRVGAFTYAAGAWLPKIGVISGGDMTATCAYVKTMILLAAAEGQGWDFDDICMRIGRNMWGECDAHGADSGSFGG